MIKVLTEKAGRFTDRTWKNYSWSIKRSFRKAKNFQ